MRLFGYDINIKKSTPDIFKNTYDLYFYCPNCDEWVKLNKLEDGRTMIDWFKEESDFEFQSMNLSHNECGFEFKMAVSREVAIKIVEDSYAKHEN